MRVDPDLHMWQGEVALDGITTIPLSQYLAYFSSILRKPNTSMGRPKANPATIQKLIDNEVRIEQLQAWVQRNVPAKDIRAMREQATAEFNRRRDVYPSDPLIHGDAEMANFWRKFDNSQSQKPATAIDYMLHMFSHSFASQNMIMYELDKAEPGWMITVNREVKRILIEKGLAQPRQPHPQTSDVPLLQWVGETLTVNRNGIVKPYLVADAVSSAMRGSHFVLQDPQNEADSFEVPNDLFEEMVLHARLTKPPSRRRFQNGMHSSSKPPPARNHPSGALRTPEETDSHEHARKIVNVAPVHIRKIGNAPKRVIPDGAKFQHALEGIRVLDLAWILGGPVGCVAVKPEVRVGRALHSASLGFTATLSVGGRTLAAHGADVLHVTSPNLHSEPLLDTETSRGKRTTQLDLNNEADSSTLWDLVKEADVFLQSYRPNSLAQRGFGPNAVAEARPGIVYASLSGYGHEGLLNFRRGVMGGGEADAYRSFVEATGGDASNLPPYRDLPMQALEHASGFLLAYGIIAALCRTITEGGSWEVNVSLVSTLFWIRSMEGVNPV
ncbi:hypothetical protein EVG20_g11065, partial [Dentipellis fragilis]